MNRIVLFITQGLSKKVLQFLVELVCIVIAVTLSFYLDDVREERRDREVLKGVIGSLITDVDELNTVYGDMNQFANSAIDTIDLCVRLAHERKPIPTVTLHSLIYYISSDHSFDAGTSAAYVGLLSSQVWQEIPDSIKRSVFDLYEGNYGATSVTTNRVAEYCAFIKTQYFPKLHIDLYNVKGDTWAFESHDRDKDMRNITNALTHPEFRSALIMLRNEYLKASRYFNEAIVGGEENVARLKSYLSKL